MDGGCIRNSGGRWFNEGRSQRGTSRGKRVRERTSDRGTSMERQVGERTSERRACSEKLKCAMGRYVHTVEQLEGPAIMNESIKPQDSSTSNNTLQ